MPQRSMIRRWKGLSQWAGWRDLLQIGLTLGVFLIARTVIAAPYYVPTGSMEPTLRIGDELLAMKYAYGYGRFSAPVDLGFSGRWLGGLPERGDVVVFRPPNKPSETWVKRVIGLPGDRIRMRQGRLEINDQRLPLQPDGADAIEGRDGQRIPAARLIETLPGGGRHPILKVTWTGPLDNTPLFVVPPGQLFLMGDSRDNSLDSRVAPDDGGLGFVPVENLLGRAGMILGSWDFPLGRQSISQWLPAVRLSRFFARIG